MVNAPATEAKTGLRVFPETVADIPERRLREIIKDGFDQYRYIADESPETVEFTYSLKTETVNGDSKITGVDILYEQSELLMTDVATAVQVIAETSTGIKSTAKEKFDTFKQRGRDPDVKEEVYFEVDIEEFVKENSVSIVSSEVEGIAGGPRPFMSGNIGLGVLNARGDEIERFRKTIPEIRKIPPFDNAELKQKQWSQGSSSVLYLQLDSDEVDMSIINEALDAMDEVLGEEGSIETAMIVATAERL